MSASGGAQPRGHHHHGGASWRSVTFKQNPQPTERPRGRRVLYELLLHLIQPRRSNPAVVAIVIVGALRQRHARRPARVGAIDFVAQTQTFRYECPTQILFSFWSGSPTMFRTGIPEGLRPNSHTPSGRFGWLSRGSFFRAPFARALCTPTPQV